MKPDKAAQDRTRRLLELQRELAVIAGFDPDDLTADQRVRVECGGLLRLQHEQLAARLIRGDPVDTSELLRLDEVLATLLPPAKAGKGEPLQVTFVDPRLSRLSDEELATLEAIVARMNDVPVEDISPTPEQLAIEALQAECDRLRRNADQLTEHYSGIIREYERDRAAATVQERVAGWQTPADQKNAPSTSAESPNTVPTPANVVSIRSAASALAFDPIIGRVPPHLDARKIGWPEY